jgi:hypothetical protein
MAFPECIYSLSGAASRFYEKMNRSAEARVPTCAQER